MTIQTKLNRKLGFRQEVKILATVRLFLFASCLFLCVGNVFAGSPKTFDASVIVMAESGTVQGSASLSEPNSSASLSISMDPTFVANFPSAVMTANMESDNQTIAITVFNAPTSGRQTVGSISVTDSSGAEVAFVTVKLKDGVIEGSISEF